jgi:hypothetical protein
MLHPDGDLSVPVISGGDPHGPLARGDIGSGVHFLGFGAPECHLLAANLRADQGDDQSRDAKVGVLQVHDLSSQGQEFHCNFQFIILK